MSDPRAWLCPSCGLRSTSSPAVGARYCRTCGERCIIDATALVLPWSEIDATVKVAKFERLLRSGGKPVAQA